MKAALFGILLLAASASAASAADIAWPGRTGRYVFEVTRNGDSIGTQIVEIKKQGDTLISTTESKIAVKLLGIVVYRLHQTLTETYNAGRLVAVSGENVDGNGRRIAELSRDAGNHWVGHYNKETRAFDCDCTVTPMWHVSSMRGDLMIEASVGQLRSVTIADRGMETLDLPEGNVEAHHFTVAGDVGRDVWYDGAGNLVSAAQLGSDGSKIRQILLSDPSGTRPNARGATSSPAD
jgi:Family of unknown function (DUF6134)